MRTAEIMINVETVYWQEEKIKPISETTWQEWFKTWLGELSEYLPPALGYELSLRLSGDREIAEYNYKYRHQAKATDVLAFAALESSIPVTVEMTEEPLYLGDIIISVETAKVQANKKGHSLNLEIAWLATHGCLHLLGWDHPDDQSLEEMLNQQEKLLLAVGLNGRLLK